ncbi:uncharacterized protein LOC124920888 [Impatiens glandulifera]|uniref:uncharacterized protein LOC124920888 n=1 Tax=Impatiens glandulifera TaxID=253017 RepID=UPI001FB0C7CB|nr:uncharacterized protein LOC124920888 [Impatiens glandulifera]
MMEKLAFLYLILAVSSFRFSSCDVSVHELSLVVGESTSLQISPSLRVENSPGSKPGSVVLSQRVHIHGVSRLRNLIKYPNSLKLIVLHNNTVARSRNVEVCFHRNLSLAIGMCTQGKWDKLVDGSWIRSMSPFDHILLDVRMESSSQDVIDVSVGEEFHLWRVVFLILGIVLMSLAPRLSKSLVFYYSSAMTLGILLVILMILFQGMKLLPTGRKSSFAIFLYSSMIGLGSFLLQYLSRSFQSILSELGITQDMYNPLMWVLVVFLLIIGAAIGFWMVKMCILAEDGLVDLNVAHFVMWSIQVIAAAMILQSSLDSILAAEALLCGILISLFFRKIFKQILFRHFYRRKDQRPNNYRYSTPHPKSVIKDSSIERTSTSEISDSDTFYSTFHKTPDRRKLSKDEWKKLTEESTKKAMKELVSSPDFSKWAVAHADRLTLTPTKEVHDNRRGWFPWS